MPNYFVTVRINSNTLITSWVGLVTNAMIKAPIITSAAFAAESMNPAIRNSPNP
jgi:hypothetical protein